MHALAAVNAGRARRAPRVVVPFSKKALVLATLLLKTGALRKIIVKRAATSLYLHFYLAHCAGLQNCARPALLAGTSQKFFVTRRAARLLQKRSGASLIVLSTDRGCVIGGRDVARGGLFIGCLSS